MGEFVDSFIGFNQITTVLIGAFVVCFVGYLIGKISIKGVQLGTAGVFLAALVFGYLYTLPVLKDVPVLGRFFVADPSASSTVTSYKFLESIGLVLFVSAVGFIAGPGFFRDLKKNIKSYVPIAAIMIGISSVLAFAFSLVPGIGSSYGTGILSGALTSTPAFSAAKQVASNEGLVCLGNAVAYPFGVIGVVLFVQLVPKLMKVDMAKERLLIKVTESETKAKEQKKSQKPLVIVDSYGIFAFGVALVLGMLLGAVKIPITAKGFDGSCFSLGNTGGVLIAALLLGHFGKIGRISFKIPDTTLKVFREFGLVMFLIGAGVQGGVQLVSQINASEYGIMLVVYGFLAGVVMTLSPLFVGFLFAKKFCKLPLLNNLGSLTGGETSTPALGMLISVSGTEDVAASYASTYPIALVLIVIASNLIGTLIV